MKRLIILDSFIGCASPPLRSAGHDLADKPATGSLSMIFSIAARRLRSRLAGATSHRSEWAATKQVHIDENHGTLRRVETNGLAAGAKCSPAMLECVHQDGKTWQLGLVPAEPAPSTRLNLSVPTRRRHPATAKDRCFHSRTQTKRILASCPCSGCDRIKPTQTAKSRKIAVCGAKRKPMFHS